MIAAFVFLFVGVTIIVIALPRPIFEIKYEEEMPNRDTIERVNEIIAGAARDREQLEARAAEIVKLHGYRRGTCEADTLESVVWDGLPYQEALQFVMKLKRT